MTPLRVRDNARQRRHVTGIRIGIVASQFNESVTKALLDGAQDALTEAGVARGCIETVSVPGAFELPVAAAAMASSGRVDAIVALGCLIRGETPQYAAIGQAVANGLMQVSVTQRIPVGFGVLIADSFAQAKARAGGRRGNRGQEAARAALAMIPRVWAIGRAGSRRRRR